MAPNSSFAAYAAKRYRLAGKAVLDAGHPWFVPLDELKVDIERRGGSLTSFANYDYLGLAGHPDIRKAATEALNRYGTGALGSRLVGGERSIHANLEHAIASFMGTEACLTLVSGYLTNVSIISHLLGPRDILVVDELSHNSIVTGARGSRARLITFRHNDLDHLDHLLKTQRRGGRCLIVVEGLYSMDGDLPDLPRLLALKDTHDAWLLVDEAQSLGVLGSKGRGISEYFGEDPARIDLIVGTLSKAMVSCGGFLCAKREIIDWLRFTLSGFVFSVGLSPVITAAAHAALNIIAAEPERTAKVRRAAERFLGCAQAAGLNTGTAVGRGIVPIMFSDLPQTMRASRALLAHDIYAPPIVHVGVPKDLPRIRFFLSASHDGHKAIETAVSVLAELKSTKQAAAASQLAPLLTHDVRTGH
jgi:8-amino-7-oxononanoate synthase